MECPVDKETGAALRGGGFYQFFGIPFGPDDEGSLAVGHQPDPLSEVSSPESIFRDLMAGKLHQCRIRNKSPEACIPAVLEIP
jgi:hypothetical protein